METFASTAALGAAGGCRALGGAGTTALGASTAALGGGGVSRVLGASTAALGGGGVSTAGASAGGRGGCVTTHPPSCNPSTKFWCVELGAL